MNSRKKRNRPAKTESIITAGAIEQFAPETVTAIPSGQFYLACLADGSFLALSRTCTHLGCSVPWVEEKNLFVCPCHGSTFNFFGEVLTSPAPRPLDTFPVRIENGIVKVDISAPRKRERFDPSQATLL
jgi:Rieske Fe-S protein